MDSAASLANAVYEMDQQIGLVAKRKQDRKLLFAADRERADAIVQFAMRKDPGMRYPSVADFADDIRRHLARRPVAARHRTFAYRAKCLMKRNGSRLAAGTLATRLTVPPAGAVRGLAPLK